MQWALGIEPRAGAFGALEDPGRRRHGLRGRVGGELALGHDLQGHGGVHGPEGQRHGLADRGDVRRHGRDPPVVVCTGGGGGGAGLGARTTGAGADVGCATAGAACAVEGADVAVPGAPAAAPGPPADGAPDAVVDVPWLARSRRADRNCASRLRTVAERRWRAAVWPSRACCS